MRGFRRSKRGATRLHLPRRPRERERESALAVRLCTQISEFHCRTTLPAILTTPPFPARSKHLTSRETKVQHFRYSRSTYLPYTEIHSGNKLYKMKFSIINKFLYLSLYSSFTTVRCLCSRQRIMQVIRLFQLRKWTGYSRKPSDG